MCARVAAYFQSLAAEPLDLRRGKRAKSFTAGADVVRERVAIFNELRTDKQRDRSRLYAEHRAQIYKIVFVTIVEGEYGSRFFDPSGGEQLQALGETNQPVMPLQVTKVLE